ncbi:CapA family protein [Leptolyngbya sp. 7M]|uniref:CapA family protein n=1 Tax=Leptolyngbya sp. 7M TaxID=2812896 RepID=UPI001B8B700A|nr:CapA family protein [Leptolyngbya sp. 7M]QYO66605.1 CapA family protein [Leptolyngbya sp. 7M]
MKRFAQYISFGSVLFVPLLLSFSGCQALGKRPIEPIHFVETAASPMPSPSNKETITIAAVGDIMLGSPFPNDSRMPPNDGADLLKEVAPILRSADIAFGNLEGPMTDGGTSTKCREPKPGQPIRCFAFRMPTRYGKYLKDAGFDILSLANNHALDFGAAGAESTRRTLDELGIKHAGSDKIRFSTAYLEVNGLKIAFIGFAHNNVVPNVNDLAGARRLVLEADKNADIVVVSFHGGAEGTDSQNVPNRVETYFGELRGNLPLFSRTVIDAGADLVLGHGPHVLRGMEIYKDRLIAYSLGNFATYGWFRLEAETALTAILEVELARDGSFLGGKIHAGRQEGRGIPILDPSGEAIKKIRSLSVADFGPNAPKIADDGKITKR